MINVVGFPFDLNSSFLKGPAHAPDAIRQIWLDGSSNDFSENLTDLSDKTIWTDIGNLSPNEESTENYFQNISDLIFQIASSGDQPLSLGGDHSITFPVIRGLAKRFPTLHVLHLDAHPDLYNNFETNPYSHASPFARVMENGFAASLTQIGIRAATRHQKEQAEKFKVKQFPRGKWNIDVIRNLSAPLYISVDLDVLDPAFAPGISHYEPGGLTTREVLDIIQSIPVKIVGADIVEYNPTRDIHSVTATVAYKIMKELLSEMHQQYKA